MIQASDGAQGFVQVDLDGRMYEVRLKVITLGGFSGHADQRGLVSFSLQGQTPARRIVLVHGEAKAKHALAVALGNASGLLGRRVEVVMAQAGT